MRVRPGDYPKGGFSVSLLTNITLGWKKLARDQHSSLFVKLQRKKFCVRVRPRAYSRGNHLRGAPLGKAPALLKKHNDRLGRDKHSSLFGKLQRKNIYEYRACT